MSTEYQLTDSLNELLDYTYHLAQLNEKPVFQVEEFSQFRVHSSKFSHANNTITGSSDLQDNIWLKIKRVSRTDPPKITDEIKNWIDVSNDPEQMVTILKDYSTTLTLSEVNQLLEKQIIGEKDVSEIETLEASQENEKFGLRNVNFSLENHPELQDQIHNYINTLWQPWADAEIQKFADVQLYETFFNLYQSLEKRDDAQTPELVCGIGVMRWITPIGKLDYPLIEHSVELELDANDGSILVKPRNRASNLALNVFMSMQNLGVTTLSEFATQHFETLIPNKHPSPFNKDSYEPVLRKAVSVIDPAGSYWPDETEKHKRIDADLPPFTEQLKISGSWMLFTRPRNINSYLQDISRFREQLSFIDSTDIGEPIKRFVSELSNEKPVSNSNIHTQNQITPYFPKVFNEAQLQIIQRLQVDNSVTVQGPPGTGKTHTIANIICHYLALGKRILVTSKGKTALEVLHEQIPAEIRKLCISFLSNERASFQQLESAIELLSSITSQTDLHDLNQQAKVVSKRESDLRSEIEKLDLSIKEHGLSQLVDIPLQLSNNQKLNAMMLAQEIKSNEAKHAWLKDDISYKNNYIHFFDTDDINQVKNARIKLGAEIRYVGKRLPHVAELPKDEEIAGIHQDLVNAAHVNDRAKSENLPLVSSSQANTEELINTIQPKLKRFQALVAIMEQYPWLRALFNHWSENRMGHKSYHLFEDRLSDLEQLILQRKEFIKSPVLLPDLGMHRAAIKQAVEKLCDNKAAFGLFSFHKKLEKLLLNQIEVEGEQANTKTHWKKVNAYLDFQNNIRRFVVRWNSVAQEIDLPELSYQYGDSIRFLENLQNQIQDVCEFSLQEWGILKQNLQQLFPLGLNISNLLESSNNFESIFKSLQCHADNVIMTQQRHRLDKLEDLLANYQGDIVENIRKALQNKIGNPIYTADQVMNQWHALMHEVTRLQKLTPQLKCVDTVSSKIEKAGAKIWANSIKTTPVKENIDDVIPEHWPESWLHRQQVSYLSSIEKNELHSYNSRREQLEQDLNQVFIELIRIKTYIGLHQTLSDRVQSALVRFVTAVTKMGKGTGKRAPRYQQDANRAMHECYDGVPCWIMPSWRISEVLPSHFASFDLVIIDEASQSDISVLPAILRAKKLLVVGDDKQVSPTGAFITEEKILQLKRNYLKTQPFAELLLPGNSIYDLANAVFPKKRIMLTEHFRCVEDIIQFSMKFYNEPLIPLRLAKPSERLDPPLLSIYVEDGIRDEKTKINHGEKDAIVCEVKSIVNNPSLHNRSIGIISLIGIAQANAIQEALIEQLGEESYLKHNITCGDSATFQGKERDIILLSLVVGPGQGTVLNKRENMQRFNVAMSRARDRMILVHSIKESDLSNMNDLRYQTLQFFLNKKDEVMPKHKTETHCRTDLERKFYQFLNDKGYNVSAHVVIGPYEIDLMVEGACDQRIAIQLDGDEFQTADYWLEQLKRKQTLERVGWHFWHCWGSHYVMNSQSCLNELVEVLNSYQIFPVESENEFDREIDYEQVLE